jgi:hypothetical protein
VQALLTPPDAESAQAPPGKAGGVPRRGPEYLALEPTLFGRSIPVCNVGVVTRCSTGR